MNLVLQSLFLISILLGGLLSGCTWKSQKVQNQVVVKVNEQTMTLKDYSEKLSRQLKNFDAVVARNPSQIQRSRDSILRDFIIDALLQQYAKSLSIEVSPAEGDAEANAIRASYPDDFSFRKVLAEENLSLSEWRDQVIHRVLQRKVFTALNGKIKGPTEADLQKFYEENKDRFKYKDRIFLRQIVLDDLGKAQDVLNELKKKKRLC